MQDRELMQQALDALELLAKYENPQTKIQVRKPRDGGSIVTMYPHKVATDAAGPLRERLARKEQEPVAWVYPDGLEALKNGKCWTAYGTHQNKMMSPLYTAPQQRQDDIGDRFAHRLAVMLECALLNPTGTWNDAHKLLDEYRQALQERDEQLGIPYVSPLGKD